MIFTFFFIFAEIKKNFIKIKMVKGGKGLNQRQASRDRGDGIAFKERERFEKEKGKNQAVAERSLGENRSDATLPGPLPRSTMQRLVCPQRPGGAVSSLESPRSWSNQSSFDFILH